MNITWNQIKEKKGALVAFNKTMQPLLLWWYKSLRKYSSLPIAFVGLGISENVKKWCKDHGYFFDSEKYVSFFKKKQVPAKQKEKWFQFLKEDVTDIRPYWFTKPIAMMQTPFEKTLYLDIDCEIKASIDEIFFYSDKKNEIALCKDLYEIISQKDKNQKEILFNSGVIIYKNKSEIIEKWAKLSLECYNNFLGDQDLLSHIIHKYKYNPKILPIFWNWHVALKEDKKIKIRHWGGSSKIKLLEKIKKDSKLVKQIKELLIF